MPNRVDELASSVMGAVKSIKATVEGLSGVFKHLTHEHGEVTALLLRVKMSSDPQVRRDLFPKIRTELLSHEKGELEEVYPAFRKRPELAAMAATHEAEAGELERTLTLLGSTPYEHDAWKTTFDKLVELVSHHAKEEENEFFPAANTAFGKEEAERLLTRYEAAKAQWVQRSS